MRKLFIILSFIIVLLGLSACSSGEDASPPPASSEWDTMEWDQDNWS